MKGEVGPPGERGEKGNRCSIILRNGKTGKKTCNVFCKQNTIECWLVKITWEACHTRNLNVGTWVVKRVQERDNYLLTRNITFPLLLQHYVTKQVALLCCPFYCSFSYSVTKRVQITKSCKLIIEYFRKQGLEETKFGVSLKHWQRLCVIPKAQLNQVILWLDPEQIVQEASEFSWSII